MRLEAPSLGRQRDAGARHDRGLAAERHYGWTRRRSRRRGNGLIKKDEGVSGCGACCRGGGVMGTQLARGGAGVPGMI